jgi:hypothetical protein
LRKLSSVNATSTLEGSLPTFLLQNVSDNKKEVIEDSFVAKQEKEEWAS